MTASNVYQCGESAGIGSKVWDQHKLRLKLLALNVCEYEYTDLYITDLVIVGKDWWLEPILSEYHVSWKFNRQPKLQSKATPFKYLPGKIKVGTLELSDSTGFTNINIEIKDYSSAKEIGKLLEALDTKDYLTGGIVLMDYGISPEEVKQLATLYDD